MRALAILSALAMIAGLFLPWLRVGDFTPWDLIRHLEPDAQAAQDFVTSAPIGVVLFLGSFALAGLFALLAIIGLPYRLLALAAGGLALGITGYSLWRLRDSGANIGLPLPRDFSTTDLLRIGHDVMDLGAWAWGGGAVMLFLCGLVGFSRR